MIIFNTTYHIGNNILDEFIGYLKNDFVPQAINKTGLKNPRLTRVLTQENQEGSSMALQFEVNSLEELDNWYDETGDSLNEDMVARFGSDVVGFSTLLEVIDL